MGALLRLSALAVAAEGVDGSALMAGYFCTECRKVVPVHEWRNHKRRHVNPTIHWPRLEAQLPLWREKV